MIKGYVRDANWADLPILVADLRDADIAEVQAFSGRDPEEALRDGLNAISIGGRARVACLPNGIPAAIYGVVPVAPRVGAIWMLATNQFHRLHRQFLRECRQEIDDLTEGYRLVFNFTDARNKVHHRWIEWAGFTIIKRHEKFGAEQRPFLEFVRITESKHV